MNIISLNEAADRFLQGSVGVIPTDTVYGLVARAHNEAAVTRMYSLKAREQKPGTLIAADIQQLIDLGVSPDEIDKVKQWWPNPLSAVLKIEDNSYLHQNVGSLAMRVVKDDKIKKLLEVTGPLITSSANQPGQPPATTIDEAYRYFGDSVDFYVDGGIIDGVAPSTIVRPTVSGIEILRQGSVTL